MTHDRYVVQLGERGRVVLPAPLRRALDLERGDQLVLELEEGAVRLTPGRALAARFHGAFRGRYGGRSLADELLAERREEAAREAGAPAGR
jgi:AbrB family looped-hinge helix DNA binding protein